MNELECLALIVLTICAFIFVWKSIKLKKRLTELENSHFYLMQDFGMLDLDKIQKEIEELKKKIEEQNLMLKDLEHKHPKLLK